MKVDLLSLIKSCRLFTSFDEKEIKELMTKLTKVYLHKNKILFHQGDWPDGLFILVKGKLSTLLKKENREEKVIRTILPGEIAGELSALSNEPRSGTIKAVQDSILLKLPSEVFKELCRKYPSIMMDTLNTYVTRTRDVIQLLTAEEPLKKHIVIIAANTKANLKKFYEKIFFIIKKTPRLALLADFELDLNKKLATDELLLKKIDKLSKENEMIFYFLSSPKSLLAKLSFERVDMIYVLANNDVKPVINRLVLEKINSHKKTDQIKPELILLHEDELTRPERTTQWLRIARFHMHHHIRINLEKDCQRIVRFLCGKAIGLVLGGGGVRSWAHLGAIKAVLEAGIPIDAIGGTSAGAVVGGYYAIHETYEDYKGLLGELSEVTRKVVSIRNITWPAVSLFDGKAYTAKQKKIFGRAKIQDLWLPCFFVACNLSKDKQVIHRAGRLWKAIRASTAVPAIFPPVVIKGQLHLDGGILNNLPVDVMRKMIGSRGTIIAVELTHHAEDKTEYNFPTTLTFSQVLLAKTKLAHRDYKFPSFIETFLKSLLAGASAKQEQNSLAADLLISPDLSNFGLLDVSKEQEKELIDIGYKTTVKAIKKWHRKKSSTKRSAKKRT